MIPDPSDIMAARRIFGEPPGAETHRNVASLPGADRCVHRLWGSGVEIPDKDDRDFWSKHPYRHHEYTPRGGASYDCVCGNSDGNPCHQLCYEVN